MTDERREPVYVLNRNEGTDILHRDAGERCNVDDSQGRQAIDAETADALLTNGSAVRCRHCYAEA